MPERSQDSRPFLTRLSKRPAAAMTLSFSAGIAASTYCACYSFPGLVLAGLLLSAAAYLAWHRDRPSLCLGTCLAAIGLSGLLMALAHRDSHAATDLRHLIRRREFPLNEPVSFEGCLTEDGVQRGSDMVTTVEFQAFLKKGEWLPCKGSGILRIALTQGEPEREIPLARGDRVRAWAVWQTPRNFRNPGATDRAGLLERRGIFLVGRVKSTRLLERIPGGCSGPVTRPIAAVTSHVRASLRPPAGTEKGQPAAVLASLVIGDYSGLGNATREAFQNTGTYHALVVSGLHVAWIAGMLLQLFRLCRIPDRTRYCLAAIAIFFYAGMVGFQASITRCLWMFLLYLLARTLFRRADAANVLLSAALLLLAVRPAWLFETGFQLSFLAVMAIAITAVPAIQGYLKPFWDPLSHAGEADHLFLQAGKWWRRGRRLRIQCELLMEEIVDSCSRHWGGPLLWVGRMVGRAAFALSTLTITSLCVQLWLEPLLAFHFNRISWVAPLANVLIVPMSSIVLALGIIAVSASPLPGAGPPLLAVAGSSASFLVQWTTGISEGIGGWQRCPTLSPPAAFLGIALVFAWSFFGWRRFWIPCAYVVSLLAFAACSSLAQLDGFYGAFRNITARRTPTYGMKKDATLRMTFLDVGDGDSIVIRFPNRQTWLLDAGGLRVAPQDREEEERAFDIGEAVVSRYLWHEWVPRLDRVILSHADQDHGGGMPTVMKNFHTHILNHARSGPDPVLQRVLETAAARKIPVALRHAGESERVGPVTVRVCHPPAGAFFASSNESSLVLQFRCGRFSALLTGDLEKAGERELVTRADDLRSLLLKVAHHGSRSGTGNAFLELVEPRWAIVSVGRNNPFGHPSREVMARLRRCGARSFLTMQEGAITFETDGLHYVIKSHVGGIRESGELPGPSP